MCTHRGWRGGRRVPLDPPAALALPDRPAEGSAPRTPSWIRPGCRPEPFARHLRRELGGDAPAVDDHRAADRGTGGAPCGHRGGPRDAGADRGDDLGAGADEFESWWDELSARTQDDVSRVVNMLVEQGPQLPYPYCSAISQSSSSERVGPRRSDSFPRAVRHDPPPLVRVDEALEPRAEGRQRSRRGEASRRHPPAPGSGAEGGSRRHGTPRRSAVFRVIVAAPADADQRRRAEPGTRARRRPGPRPQSLGAHHRPLPGEVLRPIVHQQPPPLEQIRPGVGRLHVVLDDVRQRPLNDLPRMVGRFPPSSPGTTTGSPGQRRRSRGTGASSAASTTRSAARTRSASGTRSRSRRRAPVRRRGSR